MFCKHIETFNKEKANEKFSLCIIIHMSSKIYVYSRIIE